MPTPRRLILPSADVAAVRAGAKTQHRVPVKRDASGRVSLGGRNWHLDDPNAVLACPLGKVGDLLWVPENHWRFTGIPFKGLPWDGFVRSPQKEPYKAICYDDSPVHRAAYDACAIMRMSAAQMPAWASRTTLEITDVRVQKLQDISEADAVAEGCKICDRGSSSPCYVFQGTEYDQSGLCHSSPVTAYGIYWDQLNAKRDPWDSNPFVWAISFRRV